MGRISSTESGAIHRPRRSKPAKRGRLDGATLFGFAAGTLLVAAAMMLGGSPGSFFDLPALLIVLGGTIGVTVVSFSLEDVTAAIRIGANALFRRSPDPSRVSLMLLSLADRVRQRGPLEIEDEIATFRGDDFARDAMTLVVDDVPTEEIERILNTEIYSMADRHDLGAAIFRKAAEVSPAMGLIGTLIGLVQMLSNLSEPDKIGPAMAIALLTTFYGAVLSSMVFGPIAAKLERNSEQEALVRRIYALASVSMSRQENVRRLETMLNALLPPAKRVAYFD